MLRHVLAVLCCATACPGLAETVSPAWDQPVPVDGRANPYELPPDELAAAVRRGLTHALVWPEVDHTAVVPERPVDHLFRDIDKRPVATWLLGKLGLTPFGTSWQGFFDGLGLPRTPGEQGLPLGASRQTTAEGAQVVSFGCAACHMRSLFGKPVVGLGNLKLAFTTFAAYAKQAEDVPDWLFRAVSGATAAETASFHRTKDSLRSLHLVTPNGPGVDTGQASLALTLSHGQLSADGLPRSEVKAPPWWNVKYKNRWEADGAFGGNPVLVNLVENDALRGGDPTVFKGWLKAHPEFVRDLTAYVFATEAPRWTDFFPASSIDLQQARAGKVVFDQHCARCHGTYDKDWDQGLATTHVHYHPETFAVDVGTDPGRADAESAAAPLWNALAVVQEHGLTDTAEPGGYVPPPLVGIWARWPYFHNGSAASLCEVLTPAAQRTETFYVGPADDPGRDFDADCVGLPLGANTPAAWRKPERLFDSRRPGLGHPGHDEGIFLRDGVPLFGPAERRALIAFLKTL